MSLTYTLCNVVIHLCVVRTPSRCEEITFREYWLKRLVENGSLEIFLRPGIVSIVFSGVIDPFTFCENVSGKIHHTLGGRPLEGCKRSPSLDSQSATHRVRVGRAGEREKRRLRASKLRWKRDREGKAQGRLPYVAKSRALHSSSV